MNSGIEPIEVNWMDGAGETEYIAEPIRFTSILATTYTNNEKNMKVYAASSGVQAMLHEIDIASATCLREVSLPGATHIWAITQTPEGNVYAGSSEGHLYRWMIGSDQVDDLGLALTGEQYIWQMVYDGFGMLYGCTYPNGKIFRYNEQTMQIDEVVELPSHVKYARDIALYGRDTLFCGTGSQQAEVYQIDLTTGNAQLIQPPRGCEEDAFSYTLSVVGDHLFVVFNPSSSMYAYHIPTATWRFITNHAVQSKVVAATDGGVYFFCEKQLMLFNPSTWQLSSIGEALEMPTSRSGLLNNNTIVNLNLYGDLLTINIESGESIVRTVEMTGHPIKIRSICKDAEECNLYFGGYLFGGFARFDLKNNHIEAWKGVRQPENLCFLGEDLYLGLYPHAGLARYKPDQPWNAKTNPVELFDLIDRKQDRPFAMCAYEDKLIMGTIAYYGELQGLLTVYNSTEGSHESYMPVENHSIVALAVKGDLVYGGTSIWGGLGIDPAPGDGRLFIWDVASQRTVWQGVPLAGQPVVSDLVFDDQGNLWGIGCDQIFRFDSHDRKVDKIISLQDPAYPVQSGHYWKNNHIAIVKPGVLAVISESRLITVDILSAHPRAELLDTAVEQFVTIGGEFIYYTKEARLYSRRLK